MFEPPTDLLVQHTQFRSRSPEEGRRKKHKSALMVSLARLNTVDDVVVEHCRL